jgi:hypothetical protein
MIRHYNKRMQLVLALGSVMEHYLDEEIRVSI